MKVLYILEDGRFGGMAKMIVDLAYNVRSRNLKPKVIIGSDHSDHLVSYTKSRDIEYEKVPLHILSKNKKSILEFFFFMFSDVAKLINIIKKTDPDIIYCNGSQHIKGVVAARLLGKKVIWHMHDTYQHQIVMCLFQSIRAMFTIKTFASSCERTIQYYDLPVETTLLSLPPIDTKEFTPSISLSRKKRKGEINILTVANVNPDKGLETLLYTAAEVNKSRNDIKFKVVGLIPETQLNLYSHLIDLSKRLEVKNVKFVGQREDIFALLEEADLYLCCSNNESGPISVFEAMSMQVPVVSTDVGDLKKIFAIHNCGRIQPVKDFHALSEEILTLLNNPLDMNNFGKNGRLTAIQQLDVKILADRHVQFYQKLINRRN
jgi:glycosyltransferase involved in cell wall biosynthesis